jgi:hypothetical protein
MSATFAIRERVGRFWYVSISSLFRWQLSPRQNCTIMVNGYFFHVRHVQYEYSYARRYWARARRALTITL